MDNVERYLRLATWGLWGEHKRTVRMELASHIHHKANQYEALGYTPSAAITRALSDLGPPHVVSAGMNGVYTMPNILRNTLLCAVLATLGVGNLTGSMAQVATTTRVPIPECANGQKTFVSGTQPWPCVQPNPWINLSSLRATLEPKGVKFSQGSPAAGVIVFLRFPGTNIDITLLPETKVYFGNEQGTTQTFSVNPTFISIRDFRAALANSPLPVRITGWDKATVSVGETRFTLGTLATPMLGNDFYSQIIDENMLEKQFPSLIPNREINELEDLLIPTAFENPLTMKIDAYAGYSYKIKVKDARPNDLYLVQSREGPTDFIFTGEQRRIIQNVRRVFISPISKDGLLSYNSPSKKLTVSSPDKLPRCVIDGAGTISVLRFSGRIDFNATDTLTRVAPEDVTIQAVK